MPSREGIHLTTLQVVVTKNMIIFWRNGFLFVLLQL